MIRSYTKSTNNSLRIFKENRVKSTKAMRKLSSGLRINSAADDAAGLAISDKMKAQIRGLSQAERNIEDGVSLLQVSEGGMNEINSILQRVRELGVQAGNDTNTEEDRFNIQLEVDKLLSEVDNITDTTEFNGIKVLKGEDEFKGSVQVETVVGLNITKLSMGNFKEASKSISKIDEAITIVSGERVMVGSYQNRLNYALNNASNTGENLQSSESKITDADMAKSILEYSKNSILEQAVQAMLSQTKSGVETVKNLLTT